MLCMPLSQGRVYVKDCTLITIFPVVVHMLFLAGLMGIITVGAVAFIDVESGEETEPDPPDPLSKPTN